VRGWRVVVRASRSADSTSVGLSYRSAIAQTRERNWPGIGRAPRLLDPLGLSAIIKNGLVYLLASIHLKLPRSRRKRSKGRRDYQAGPAKKEISVRDPIHDFIRLDRFPFISEIVSTREFQRLRHITQLGISPLVYPSANHTRFSHSLGTMHVMERILDHFLRVGDLNKNEFEGILKTGIAAALLHDIGHGPLSHSSEQFLNFKHEEISAQIITRPPISDILDDARVDPKTLVKIINHTVSGRYTLISQLISSELDADRLDYLGRDSYFAGVGFGTIDLERIISMLRVFKGSGILQNHAITLNKGKYAVEDYIVGRHLMYEAVYFHKATRGAERLIISAIRRASELRQSGLIPTEFQFLENDSVPSAEQILAIDDHILFSTLIDWQHANDPLLSDICRRIVERKLLKSIDLTNERFHAYHDGVKRKFLKLAKKHKVNADYLCPIDSWTVTPYKPYIVKPADDQPSVITNIFVEDDAGKPTEISQLPDADVIRALTAKKYVDRLYMPEEMKKEAEALFKS